MANRGDKRENETAPDWWPIEGNFDTGFFDDEESMKKAAQALAIEQRISFAEALEQLKQQVHMWQDDDRNKNTPPDKTPPNDRGSKDEETTEKLDKGEGHWEDEFDAEKCPPGYHLNEFGRCVKDDEEDLPSSPPTPPQGPPPGIKMDTPTVGAPNIASSATIYNEGTFLNDDVSQNFGQYVNLIKNPGEGNAGNTFLLAMAQPEMVQELESLNVDLARLFSGRIWTSGAEAEGFWSDVAPRLLKVKYFSGAPGNDDPKEPFFRIESEPHSLGWDTFGELYHAHPDTLTDRMQSIALIPGWLADSISPEGNNALYPTLPWGWTQTQTQTGVRETVHVMSPPRDWVLGADQSENDKALVTTLYNNLAKNIFFAEEHGEGNFYDYVSDYANPQTVGFFEDTTGVYGNKLSLTLDGKPTYNYHSVQYESYISSSIIPEAALPDHNIAMMYKLQRDPYDSSETADADFHDALATKDISQITNEKFKQYYNYVTVFGTLDPFFLETQTLPEEIAAVPTGDYYSQWAARQKMFVEQGPLGENWWKQYQARYDDIIFPYDSAILGGLDKITMPHAFPMNISLDWTTPRPRVGTGGAMPQPGAAPAHALAELDFLKKVPLDHAYLSRYSNHIDAIRYDYPFIAYPYQNPGFTQSHVTQEKIPKAYWTDFESRRSINTKPIYLVSPTAGHPSARQLHVDQSVKNSLNFLEFLQNLMVHGSRLYAYDSETQTANTRPHLSLIRSYDANKESLLQPIEGAGTDLSPTSTQQDWIVGEALQRLTALFPQYQRSYGDILKGKTALSQTVGFRVKKYRVGEDGVRETEPVSNYYISSAQKATELADTFNFIDTRVKYGQRYHYEVNALHMVLGTKYRFVKIIDAGESAIKEYKIQDDIASGEGQWVLPGEGKKLLRAYGMSFEVDSFPHIKIIELPFDNREMRVLDSPPMVPEIEPVPYQYVDNKVLFLLRPASGCTEEPPIFILESDTEKFRKIYQSQYPGQSFPSLEPDTGIPDWIADSTKAKAPGYGKMAAKDDEKDKDHSWIWVDAVPLEESLPPLKFCSDDRIAKYQMFRMSTPPKNYQDFRNAEKILDIEGIRSSSTGYRDTLQPNQKYYYIFRVVDSHGHLSNPTPVYEIELVNEKGTVYIVTKIYDFPKTDLQFTKPVKRFLSIAPAGGQRMLNEEASGLNTPVNDKGQLSAIGKNKDIVLGVENQSLFGLGPNKKIKVRLTSKRTNKKLDFNLNFNLKHIETEVPETTMPQLWPVPFNIINPGILTFPPPADDPAEETGDQPPLTEEAEVTPTIAPTCSDED